MTAEQKVKLDNIIDDIQGLYDNINNEFELLSEEDRMRDDHSRFILSYLDNALIELNFIN